MPIKRIRAIVSGRVQGVYYRASTETEARRLGVTGWVRNLSNGNVEFEAEGPEGLINDLIKWAHRGPAMAHVTQVSIETIRTSQENHSFDVRY